jgi:plastocyanin
MRRIGQREGRAGLLLVPLLAAAGVAGAITLPGVWLGGHHRVAAEMSGVAFHPGVLEAAVGDTIVWINRDLVPHTATSDDGQAWTTPAIAAGDSGTLVMRKKGEWAYYCKFHPTMHGRLIVH